MKFLLLTAVALTCFCCSIKETSETSSDTDSLIYDATPTAQDTSDIQGDFNGDGTTETGVLQLIKEGELQATPWIYSLVFSDPAIQTLTFTNDLDIPPTLINEGPLNNLPGDELSVFTQAGMMMMASIDVYSLTDGMWGIALDPIQTRSLLPDSLSLNDLVFTEGGKVFYYEYSDNTLGGAEEENSDERDPGFYKAEAKLITSIEPISNRFLEEEVIGSGDVDGDGVEELMRLVIVSSDEEQATVRLEFSNPKIKALSVSGIRCSGEAWAEGDLDGKPGSEIGIMECGTMANYNFISAYSFSNGHWKKLVDEIRTRDIMPEGFDRADIIFKDAEGLWYHEDEALDGFEKDADPAQLKKTKIELK
jgi:hypothetical protein